MKQIFLPIIMALTLSSLTAEARSHSSSRHTVRKGRGVVISEQTFKNEMVGHFSNGHDSVVAFEGEVDDVGSDCTVSYSQNEKGNARITLLFGADLILEIGLQSGETVRSIRHEEGDAFQQTYILGPYAVERLIITHVDDAYDTITVQFGSTSLACGAYY